MGSIAGGVSSRPRGVSSADPAGAGGVDAFHGVGQRLDSVAPALLVGRHRQAVEMAPAVVEGQAGVGDRPVGLVAAEHDLHPGLVEIVGELVLAVPP